MTALRLFLAATLLGVTAGAARADSAARGDGLAEVLGEEAREAMANGDLMASWNYCERLLKLEEFYVADGIVNTVIAPDELLVEVRIPKPAGRVVAGYQKLRIRASIDYPALCVAVAASLDAAGKLQETRMVISALAARPHVIKRLEAFAGRTLDEATIGELALAAHKQCHPLTNINVDPSWRREMIPVFVRRAWKAALA